MAFDRGSIAPQFQSYPYCMQDRDRFLRKFTSVRLVGGCASHGCGVDRPDLIHVFFACVFQNKTYRKVNHT